MDINYTDDRVGDAILLEPCLAQFNSVNLFIKNKPLRYFFENHPTIKLKNNYLQNGIELNSLTAFWNAIHKQKHFSCGYAELLGLPCPTRNHWQSHIQYPTTEDKFVCLAPFAYSSVAGNIVRANYNWTQLVQAISLPVISLGGAGDPAIEGTRSIRGASWATVCGLLANCQCLISVETGLLHLGSSLCKKLIYLNAATPPWFCAPACQHVTLRDEKAWWSISSVLEALKQLID